MAKKLTDEQRREKALKAAIERGKIFNGIEYDYDLADRLFVAPRTYARYKSDGYRNMPLYAFGTMVRTLGITGKELCAYFGVPYE